VKSPLELKNTVKFEIFLTVSAGFVRSGSVAGRGGEKLSLITEQKE
jgi:hypothetical protein